MSVKNMSIKVADIMSRVVLTTDSVQTVHAAVKKMAAQNVGAIVVVGAAGEVLGIFTERDLMNKVVAKGCDVATTSLKDVMTASPTVVSPDDSIPMVCHLFKQGAFRHLPVVDQQKNLVGIVSVKDATKAVSDLIGAMIIQ
ncbi:MAG: CBS domain-containing protein [Candidatus Omnitrophica bacterium]|nr:CBS domain-containing protein [Candidatus Omnitrophota bacterium]